MRRGWSRARVALMVLPSLAGCGAGSGDESFSADDASGADSEATATVGDIDLGGGDALEPGADPSSRESGEEPSEPADPVGGSPLTTSGRKFISTAELGVEVDD